MNKNVIFVDKITSLNELSNVWLNVECGSHMRPGRGVNIRMHVHLVQLKHDET